jgi:hypothetical protein
MATTHGGASGDELILPVNAYGYTVPERNRLGWARQVLTGACMRQLGYRYVVDAAQYQRVATIDLADNGVYGNKRRYVVTDPATAGRYGYHKVSTATGAQAVGGRRNPGAMTTDEREGLFGVLPDGKSATHTADGRPIPAGGCIGAADTTLARAGQAGKAEPVNRLGGESYQHSLGDARVRAVFQAWSRCMAGRGYHVTSPLRIIDGFDLDTRTVTPAEIATARADVSCKQQTHLTDIWFDSEEAYQEKQIKGNPDQFHQAKIDHDTVMKAVTKILAGQH